MKSALIALCSILACPWSLHAEGLVFAFRTESIDARTPPPVSTVSEYEPAREGLVRIRKTLCAVRSRSLDMSPPPGFLADAASRFQTLTSPRRTSGRAAKRTLLGLGLIAGGGGLVLGFKAYTDNHSAAELAAARRLDVEEVFDDDVGYQIVSSALLTGGILLIAGGIVTLIRK